MSAEVVPDDTLGCVSVRVDRAKGFEPRYSFGCLIEPEPIA
jgi:hypothetical protein